MKKILIISSVWVEPNSSAAGSRMLQLIKVFQSQNWKITYVSTSVKSEFAFDLTTLGITTEIIKLNDGEFDDFLSDTKPDIVMFDRFIIEEQFGWRVTEVLPNALRILDTEDLHCLRLTRETALKEKRNFHESDLLQSEISKREIASIYRCDISLIISRHEMELLQNTFKIDANLLCYMPFLLDEISSLNHTPSFSERQHFYFVGNFLHNPNYDAILFLKQEIWPKIAKKLPKTELHIYGAYPNHKVNQLHNKKERFIIKGRAKELDKIIQNSRVCLAPLRFGAGLKGKFIEAMQNGTPSITTSIGAEAMHDDLTWSGFTTDDLDDIIEKAVQLYSDENIWNKAQQNGIEIINSCYNKKKFSTLLINNINSIQKKLQLYRNQNFIGSILQYHTLKSSKYFSKWIEEKNK